MVEPARAMVEQAALWHARLGDEHHDDERRAFEDWRSKDPLHAVAFDRISSLDKQLRGAGRVERIALKKLAVTKLSTVKKSALPVVFLCAAIIACWQARHLPIIELTLAQYRTLPGAQRSITLADGSKLTLDTDTALNTIIDAQARTLQLLRGAVLVDVKKVDVKKNAATAFVIRTDDGRARALGTAYSVRKNAHDTVVTVVRSSVEVCSNQNSRCETLTPGQRARIDGNGVTRLDDIDIEQATAWSRGWLAVNDMPLEQVLDELNRYRESPIRFDARKLAGMNVSGHYPLDTDSTLQAIARSLPITVDTSDATQIRVLPR